MRSHIGKTRHSTIVEGSVVNTQQIVTPTQRKKRTVYHTPAIIETVIEQPDIPPPPIVNVRRQVARRASVMTPQPVTLYPARLSATTVQTQNTARKVSQIPFRNQYDSRSYGVKVTEDLSSIRPPSIHQDQEAGCCHKCYVSTVGCCRLFKCPFWLCCLIPLLLLLGLIIGSYFYHKKHPELYHPSTFSDFKNVFNFNHRNESSNRNSNQNQNQDDESSNERLFNKSYRKQTKHKQPEIVQPIVQPIVQSNSNKNKSRVLSRFVQIQDKTVQIDKETGQQKISNDKQSQSKSKTDQQSKQRQNQQQSKQQPQQKRQEQSNDQQNSKSKSSNSSTSSTTTTTTRQTNTHRSQPSTKSLISSLLDFKLAPTFYENWNQKTKQNIRQNIVRHLRHRI